MINSSKPSDVFAFSRKRRNCCSNSDFTKIAFRLMKEEYDARLQAAIKSETVYKNKLLLLEERFMSTGEQLEKTENKFKECMSNIHNMGQVNFVNTVYGYI